MSSISDALSPLFVGLEQGDWVVTANQRATRFLAAQYAERKRSEGCSAWATPRLLPWEGLLSAWWNDTLTAGDAERMLLNPDQERAVWLKIVEADPEASGVLLRTNLASLASGAWKLLHDYRVPSGALAASGASMDARAFSRWAKEFAAECRKKRWITRAELAAVCAEWIRSDRLPLPPKMRFVGFDRVTPVQQHLMDAAAQAGCACKRISLEVAADGPRALMRPATAADELAFAASWAAAKLDAGCSRIAILTPDVQAVRGPLRRRLAERMASDNFSFSLGETMDRQPLGRAALLLLHFWRGAIPIEDLSWLLTSGFIDGDENDCWEFARLDAAVLRGADVLMPEMDLDSLRKLFANSSAAARNLANRLRCVQHDKQLQPALRSGFAAHYGKWAELFAHALEVLGWPGHAALSSYERQVQQRWSELLDQLASLSFDNARVRLDDALSSLIALAAETIYQPESGARIEVMGALEAAGSLFDACLFVGATDQQWPMPGSPHILLSRGLQINYGMPHSSAELDLEIGRVATERIQGSAASCFWSAALQNEYGKLFASSLLADLPMAPVTTLTKDDVRSTIEEQDEPPPAWDGRKNLPAAAIQSQSLCPFRAFASVRLQCRELSDSSMGLEAIDRGNLLHNAMQKLWNPEGAIKNSATLKEMAPEALRAEVERAVQEACAKLEAETPWERAFMQIERKRLIDLIVQWMDEEKQRAAFAVVDVEKKRENVELAGLSLNLRMDRVDALLKDDGSNSGDRVLLDYKTGKNVNVKYWEGERPDEPQLPLYAAFAMEKPPTAVAFAKIRTEKMCFEGIEERPGVLPGTKLELDAAQIESWRGTLTKIAEGFAQGDSRVDPKNAKTCEYCDFPSLCRIAAIDNLRDSDDEDEGGERE
jgi:ATP-dependent helicase/nuclease subunit B